MNINGPTDIYGLFGYPIKHTSSPAMHNTGFQKLGINAVYLPFEVKPANLSGALAALHLEHGLGRCRRCRQPHDRGQPQQCRADAESPAIREHEDGVEV